jgi:hypothetical protein
MDLVREGGRDISIFYEHFTHGIFHVHDSLLKCPIDVCQTPLTARS